MAPAPKASNFAMAPPSATATLVVPPSVPASAQDPVISGGSNGSDGNGADKTPLSPADAQALLLSVVAEKTGYPEEILAMDMDLEADLGIDSIKRVEILSALQERTPQLPELDASNLPSLQTLGQVLEFLEQVQPQTGNGGNGNGGNGKGGNGTSKAAPSLELKGEGEAGNLEEVAENESVQSSKI